MRHNKIKCPVSSLEKKRCALFFDSVIQTANNKSNVQCYGNKNEIHYQDDNNQYRGKIKQTKIIKQLQQNKWRRIK
ncbi:hypothetical protein TUSAK1_24940 [Klebsiella variicola]